MESSHPEDAVDKPDASSESWERLKSTIMRLYIDDDKTLEEVRQHLEEHYGFYANIASYKKRLAGWKAFKNLRPDEVLQILHLKKERDAVQRRSQFFIRGREVDPDGLQVYLSRNPALHAKVQAGVKPNPDAVRDVSCASPPLAHTIAAPDRQAPFESFQSDSTTAPRSTSPDIENMCSPLRHYIGACFSGHLWSWSKDHCWNAKGRRGPAELLSAVLDRCMTAAQSVNRQVEPVAVRRALDTPFTMLVRVFRNPPPNLVPKLLSAAAYLELIGRQDIQSILLQFCHDLSLAVFGEDRPLVQFWQRLLHVPVTERRNAIGYSLSACVHEYEERLGSIHPLSIEVYLQYFDVVERVKDTQEQVHALQKHMFKMGIELTNRPMPGVLQLEHALANCKLHVEQGQFEKAEEALTTLPPACLTPKDESFLHVWIGYIKWLRGDMPASGRSYMVATQAARKSSSPDCVCEALFQLENFYLRSGEPLEAERVRAERLQTLHQMHSIIWSDHGGLLDDKCSMNGPRIMKIYIGSDASSQNWRPSAFSLMTGQESRPDGT
ncbi:hypothetical protein F4780DRAFT_32135 [Xylariomycetidae sp. FL0641]|nr:hypothetical protein F4780DRAFT_32135 [Xylariomycetidae sp. FL0641]